VVSLVQQVFPPRAEGFPPPREGFLPHALSALDVWVRLGRRAGARNKMGELVGGCQSGEGLPFPGCLGAVGMYPSFPATCFPQVLVSVHAAPRVRCGAFTTFSRLGLPLRLPRAADSANNSQQASPALAPRTVLQGTGFDPARAA
jgi:hypothetical protein